jgi:predicted nucleic acid-binding protein
VIVLDTSVVSELMRPTPEPNVLEWVDQQPVTDLVITAITAAELRAAATRLPSGRKRTTMRDRVDALIDETFGGCVLPFDVDSGAHYAEIVARRIRVGGPIAVLDAQTAAICRQHDASLATRNLRNFAETGVDLVDPWTADG